MKNASTRTLMVGAGLSALAFAVPNAAQAADTEKTGLEPFNVTIRVFDPTKGVASGQDYVLPVDSPNEEHTTANAASFTKKVDGGRVLPAAFTCTKIEPRP